MKPQPSAQGWLLHTKPFWNKAMALTLHLVYGVFCITMPETRGPTKPKIPQGEKNQRPLSTSAAQNTRRWLEREGTQASTAGDGRNSGTRPPLSPIGVLPLPLHDWREMTKHLIVLHMCTRDKTGPGGPCLSTTDFGGGSINHCCGGALCIAGCQQDPWPPLM